jgi:NTE family protein
VGSNPTSPSILFLSYARNFHNGRGTARPRQVTREGRGVKYHHMTTPKIGLVLGSGSARGWSHIGVIRVLSEWGIKPDIVCGCSIGALVGGIYAAGGLDEFESWLLKLKKIDVISYFDVTLASGGLISGDRLMDFFEKHLGNPDIESLPLPFAAVATDLERGREVWLRSGPLIHGIRASISMPGIFTPVRQNDRWLVDGGLINPVPVSLCRVMGADVVIAVNLNAGLSGKYGQAQRERKRAADESDDHEKPSNFTGRLKSGFTSLLSQVRSEETDDEDSDKPGIFDVLARSLDIMQDRVTRSRMVGEPPDLTITPRLDYLGLLEFHRAAETIEEGEKRTRSMEQEIRELLNMP